MISEGLEVPLGLGCGSVAARRPCQTAINKLHPHLRPTLSFSRRLLGFRPLNLVGYWLVRALATRGSSGLNPISLFRWCLIDFFLGPELSWLWLVFVLIIFVIAPVTQGWLQISRASCPVLRLCCLLHQSCGQRRPLLGHWRSVTSSRIWFTTFNQLTVMNCYQIDVPLSRTRVSDAFPSVDSLFSLSATKVTYRPSRQRCAEYLTGASAL